MRITVILFAFITFFIFNAPLFGQIQKGSWQIGLSGAPLLELNASGYIGSLFTANVDYALTKRLSIGIMPFYGYTKTEYPVGYNQISMQYWGNRERAYKSTGLNFDLKYYPINSTKIKPYFTAVTGLGSTYYNSSLTDQSGDISYQDKERYNTLNLGIGIGASFQISKSLYIDSKVMYMRVSDFSNPSPIKFVYPSIGIIKTFNTKKNKE